MGERKGQNKYYPPDYDPRVGGLNKFLGTHALRERAKKIHLGIIIIRFEMPYNIWCEGCKNHIGMGKVVCYGKIFKLQIKILFFSFSGVRYNAEKTKVGMYYSTPVYQFRMKCHLCDNYFEIKTDPGNLDYEIVSGARRQENRWDPTQNGQIVPDTKETQRRLFDDPMYKLEHVASDLQKSDDAKPALFKLYERNHYVWDDDYSANSRLRADFRKQKKELKLEAEKDKSLLQKSSLDIELLPENDQDARLAAIMRLQSERVVNEKEKRNSLMNRPALPATAVTALGGIRSKRLLITKLSKNDLGIKRKSDATERESSKKSKQIVTATETSNSSNKTGNSLIGSDDSPSKNMTSGIVIDESKEDQNSPNSLHSIEQEEQNDSGIKATPAAIKQSLSLLCNYGSNSSSDEDS